MSNEKTPEERIAELQKLVDYQRDKFERYAFTEQENKNLIRTVERLNNELRGAEREYALMYKERESLKRKLRDFSKLEAAAKILAKMMAGDVK